MKNPFSVWEYARKRRIPHVFWQAAYPYIVTIDGFGKPTRTEVRQIECFLEYLLMFLKCNGTPASHGPNYDVVMTAMWRTINLHKFGPNHWGFRWSHSWWDAFWPYIREVGFGDVPPPTLEDVFAEVVIALEEGDTSAWDEWKRAQAYLFA